jgi:hypothetical protein
MWHCMISWTKNCYKGRNKDVNDPIQRANIQLDKHTPSSGSVWVSCAGQETGKGPSNITSPTYWENDTQIMNSENCLYGNRW